ncbi:MAG: DNA polymerase III subunit gamma/tau [Candidatus Marinimicrobia bacterium]|nr:DNA polymerase III subunit gamma/tau [Candidatus Neomarinimicrobiota bacterium]
MSHQVISLKYRPQQFEDVIGQEHITVTLKNAIKKNRLGHAYIFSGSRGTGKTTTARLLAKVVNCENPQNGNPCNECISCREITEGRSLDVLEIDGASNRGIDSIRDLREQVKYPPTRGKYKVYIIDEFHQITKDAFNALLKTLEEPPKHILFIFATTELQKVLPTILSRCQRFEFKRIPILQVIDLLRDIAQKEGIVIDEDSLLLIAKKGDGSIRDSESILEQVIAFSNDDINYESILNILGVIREDVFFKVYNAMISRKADQALQYIDDMLMRGYDLVEFVSAFSIFLRDLYIVKVHGSPDILNTTGNLRKEYHSLAQSQDERTLIRMLSIVNDELPKISRSRNIKILVESLFIKLSHLQDFVDLDRVLQQVKQKEAISAAHPQAPTTSKPKANPVAKSTPSPAAPRYQSPILTPKVNTSTDMPESAQQEIKKSENKVIEKPVNKEISPVKLEDLKAKWQEVIDCVQPKKPAIAGLLCRAGILQIQDGTVILGAEDDYSCKSLQRAAQIIRTCLKTVHGVPLYVRIEKSKVLEEQRVIKNKDIDKATQQVIQSLDGELI